MEVSHAENLVPEMGTCRSLLLQKFDASFRYQIPERVTLLTTVCLSLLPWRRKWGWALAR